MAYLHFFLWTLGAFIGMETLSYALHRWIFHGPLWRIHQTHHFQKQGTLEANDLFALFFTGVAFVLMLVGYMSDWLRSPAFPIGLGMTIYGVCYFVLHDLMTHRRVFALKPPAGYMDEVRRAHLRHHQDSSKRGCEPYGLFYFSRSKDSETQVRAKPERSDA